MGHQHCAWDSCAQVAFEPVHTLGVKLLVVVGGGGCPAV